ncbi:MAG: hypothetical protein ACT4QC_04445 [Planctomycetaceae bacterium]
MKTKHWPACLTFALVACLALWGPATRLARACPFCSEPMLTLAEQFAKADAAVLVEWVSAEMPKQEKPGHTVWKIVQAAKAPSASIAKGREITLDRFRAGKPGDRALVFGSRLKEDQIEWGVPLDISADAYGYVVQAPAPGASPEQRLGFYVKFLEHPDGMIAGDAYQEFANAPYKDILLVAKDLPRDKLRRLIGDPKTQATRLGLYGLLLGLCGTADDAALMEQLIVTNTEDYRLGIDGVIGGYLLLTGEQGLSLIEKSKILDKKVPFSETYAAMQAMRFMWSYGNGRIPAERLRSAMRLLLERSELTDLVIADLARWKDWSVQERLMQLYGAEEYNIPSIKRAIVRYMIASTKDVPAGAAETIPEHAAAGVKYLQALRDRDPKLVSDAEKFFFLN